MTNSAIVALIIINLFVMGGFIYFLSVAIKKENRKRVDEHINPESVSGNES